MAGHRTRFASVAAWALVSMAGCGDEGTRPGTLRFGQIGEIRLHISTPLLLGQGELQQALTWNSQGPWQLSEAISYEGKPGGEVTQRRGNHAEFYALWITQVHGDFGFRLFGPELDPSLEPESCSHQAPARLTVVVRDGVLDEERRWIRCVVGPLSSLVTSDAGPDLQASYLAQAAIQLRDYSLSPNFTSAFHGSFPFGTLAKGEHTPAAIDSPRVIDDANAWRNFWVAHAGGPGGLPPVDFARELVLIGAIGLRFEAGETVEVRRVLTVGDGTLVQVVWRVPGNFCSPIARTQRPFHYVVVPRAHLPRPITFAQIQREEVPCGTG